MVFKGSRGHPARHIVEPSQSDECQHTLRRMRSHDIPLLFGELTRFVQYIKGDRAFSDVVKERRQSQICKLDLGVSGPIAQCH